MTSFGSIQPRHFTGQYFPFLTVSSQGPRNSGGEGFTGGKSKVFAFQKYVENISQDSLVSASHDLVTETLCASGQAPVSFVYRWLVTTEKRPEHPQHTVFHLLKAKSVWCITVLFACDSVCLLALEICFGTTAGTIFLTLFGLVWFDWSRNCLIRYWNFKSGEFPLTNLSMLNFSIGESPLHWDVVV